MKRTCEAGTSVSFFPKQIGVAENLPAYWRKLERQGALTAVPAGAGRRAWRNCQAGATAEQKAAGKSDVDGSGGVRRQKKMIMVSLVAKHSK